jgi:hypothetical protein
MTILYICIEHKISVAIFLILHNKLEKKFYCSSEIKQLFFSLFKTDIFLERLGECVRLPQMFASLQAQVFLCFRVLLLRMSPQHIVLFWPTIVSEMVQVLMQMELDLSTDSEEFRYNHCFIYVVIFF